MLIIDNLHTYYGESHILHGISLAVNEGQVVSILGRNGVGKSTCANSIAGLIPVRSGSVVFGNQNVTGFPPYRVNRLGIALVPQGRRLFPSLTVHENIVVAAGRNRHVGPTEWTVSSVEDLFPVLGERANQAAGTLSGGEQQMLAIARALVMNPRLLILDEPSEGLSPSKVIEVGGILDAIRVAGVSVLLVEQKVDFALERSDHVYVLDRGKVVFDAAPGDVADNERIKSEYLGKLGS